MKGIKNLPLILFSFLITLLLTTSTSKADTYTAVISGNWSSSTTWGLSSSPGTNITAADVIVIPVGVTVTLDNNVEFNNSLASLEIVGSLNGSGYNLTMTQGTLTGTGSVTVNQLKIGSGGLVAMTGSITCETFENLQSLLSLAAVINVNGMLKLSGGVLELGSGANLTMNSNSTIEVSGGSMNMNGGAFNGTNVYNVLYVGSSKNTGTEISGSGLSNVTISLSGNDKDVSLTSDLMVNGELKLMAGNVVLSGNHLTLNGTVNIANGATIKGDASSNVAVNGSGNVGTLVFSVGNNSINDLSVDISSNGSVSLGSSLNVTGNLSLDNGELVLNGNDFSLGGSISTAGSASITGSATSDLSLNGSGNVGVLVFSSGSEDLDDFNVNISSNGTVNLGSSVEVHGQLDLQNGSVSLNGWDLALSGTINTTGSASVTGDATSDITFSGTGSMGTFQFTSGSAMANDLNVNISSNGSVDMGSSATVNGALNLMNGSINLNGNDITLKGTVDASGSGSISGDASSNISFNGSGNMGSVTFTSGAQTVNNLTLNIGSSGSVTLNSDLTAMGTADFTNGNIMIGDNDLTIGASGNITNASSDSYVVTNGNGQLMMSVTAGGAAVEFPVGTETNFSMAVISQNSAGSSGNVGVNAQSGVLTEGTAGTQVSSDNIVNQTWTVSGDALSQVDMDMELQWTANMEASAFDRTNCFISHYTNGEWDVVASAQATANADGSYSITRDNITSLSPFTVTSAEITGIDNYVDQEISVYPNPVRDYVTVNVPAKYHTSELRVLDYTGKKLRSIPAKEGKLEIDFSAFPEGVYFLELDGMTQKILKE